MSWKWKGEEGEGYSALYMFLVPYFVREKGGGYWTYIRFYASWGQLKSLGYRTRFRLENRWWDVRANLAGYCNDKPWSPENTRGYPHWRCALPDGDHVTHRTGNYEWNDNETNVWFCPVENSPHQPWNRHMIKTLRSQRRVNRIAERARILRAVDRLS